VFEGVRYPQYRGFVQAAPGELEADGETPACQPARHANRRQAGQVRADGEDIREIHLQRVVHALAELERGHGARRHQHGVDLRKCLIEIAPDQRAHLLGALVVGVVAG
jgi:hypothetical protein